LAITAASEHFTALLAQWMLSCPTLLDGSEARLKALWLWHSAEEAEHKCTAMNVYRQLKGSEVWRKCWMRRMTVFCLGGLLRQTLLNLWRDGTFWHPATWGSAWRHLLGRQDVVRMSFRNRLAYFRADFHPSQQHSNLARDWPAHNTHSYKAVGSRT
jgi:predicted metal-dependent hydrolase